MRVIIAGCGKVGATIAEQLSSEGHDIVVIDPNPEAFRSLVSENDVLGIVGNGAVNSVQEEAGVEQTDLFIAVTPSDELNLLCCLIAKKTGNCKTIARVRNPDYLASRSFIKEKLGLSMIINPERAAAKEIARLLKFPSAIEVDTFSKGRVELLKVCIPEGSSIAGMAVSRARSVFTNKLLICIVQRGADTIIPDGNFILEVGDKISIIAPHNQAALFMKKAGVKFNTVKDVTIIGGGKMTYYLAKELLSVGIKVKIIEIDKQRCEKLSELLPKAMIICGDGTEQQLLAEEGVFDAGAVVLLTDIDEENIMLSLCIGSSSDAKIITKVNRIKFSELISGMPIGSVVCPKHITAESILSYVRAMQNSFGSNVQTLYRLENNKVEALEFFVRAESDVVGIPLEKLNLRPNLLVSSIIRGNEIITPSGKDVIKIGDTVIVVTTETGLNDLTDILDEQ